MKRVALEPNLAHLREALAGEGYEVLALAPGQPVRADAIVVTGMSQNLVGIQDTDGSKAPVIDARGLTAEQVVAELRRRLP